MTGARIIFVDRDGTLVEEPPDEQVDSLEKIRLLPGVIPALLDLKRAGFLFVMVTNQDGLGTPSLPTEKFDIAQRFIVMLFASQGIEFDAVFVCPHFKRENCACRKPCTGLVDDYLRTHPLDKSRSYMIGDRDTDLEFAANLGIEGLRGLAPGAGAPGTGTRAPGNEVPGTGAPGTGAPGTGETTEHTWPAIAQRILGAARRAQVRRTTKETDIEIEVDLSREGPTKVSTGLGFFDHMLEQIARHGGFALSLACRGDLHIDEHHTIEDCALALGSALRQALGEKRGIARYGFLLAMDEAEAQVALDISGRPYFVWEGRFNRERVGEVPTELVPHFFRSLAETLGAALHISVRGENTHHMVEACFKGVGRSLRQAIRLEGNELPSTKGIL